MKKDSLAIDGKMYISSKRAAEIAGYSKDYVGQLCRSGKLECRTVGRLWYVDEESIRKHQTESFKSNQTSFRKAGFPGDRLSPVPAGYLSAGSISVPAMSASVALPVSGLASSPSLTSSPSLASSGSSLTSLKRISLIVLAVMAILASMMMVASMTKVFDFSNIDNSANLYSAWNRIYGGFVSLVSPHSVIQSDSDQAGNGTAQGDQSDDASMAHAGLVVVPSQGSTTDAKLTNTIVNSFSDNVTVTPGADGTTGVIKPQFRTVDGHDYLYVLVPVKTATSSSADKK